MLFKLNAHQPSLFPPNTSSAVAKSKAGLAFETENSSAIFYGIQDFTNGKN